MKITIQHRGPRGICDGGRDRGPGPCGGRGPSEGRQTRDELAADSGCQEPLTAGSTNDIALVPMDPSGYDSSEPAAMDPGTRSAADWARPTASGCCTTPPVARAGCAKSCGSWFRLCYPRGGIGSAGSQLDRLGRVGLGMLLALWYCLAYINRRRIGAREAWVRAVALKLALRERDHCEDGGRIGVTCRPIGRMPGRATEKRNLLRTLTASVNIPLVNPIRLIIALSAGAIALATAPSAAADGPYANCSQAKADGVCNITTDSPGTATSSTRTATA